MKVLTIFGTRPEAIKMIPVINELKKYGNIKSYLCVTGQHREMLDQVLNLFNIVPDFDLNIMKNCQSLESITVTIIEKLSPILENIKPDYILVHGDTSTSFIASLVAFYKQIKIAHIEAGLRTYNLFSPFPEEANRHLTSVLANLHFAPTEEAKQNLLNENIAKEMIYVTGNTVIDSLLLVKEKLNRQDIQLDMQRRFPFIKKDVHTILITTHRRENQKHGIKNIATAIKYLSEKYPNLQFVLPLHLNPIVREPLQDILNTKNNIHLIEPQEYLPFVYLMSSAHIILTDSGGIQEEAPALGKPVLLMRDTTERPEAILAGAVKLVGSSCQNIINSFIALYENPLEYKSMSNSKNPYGNGTAAKLIVTTLLNIKEN
ncbi:UDP-N-acetylglucosamine 2-epimerase (non-hydrolyzing) [Pasteurella multocida]|uniref:non-hydrolyzing UDP-N-acetylglucosamine 2-epimerase n=1 Tax=Pasteurella multocida TaxID=747 RepID=UPI002930DE0E|nr:UDP-N-acetylglucosamine 2-epimerase (non-hydrolyzing) [Pasteurella multocida]